MDLAGNFDAVILSDYAKGALRPAVCRELIEAAWQATRYSGTGRPQRERFPTLSGATTICPNLKELAIVLGESAETIAFLSSRPIVSSGMGRRLPDGDDGG